jgi:hypothetical protein
VFEFQGGAVIWLRVVRPVRVTIAIGLVLAGLICAGAVLAATTSWTVQPSPDLGAENLNGVAATSSTNAWAVGSLGGPSVIERWNGKVWKLQAGAKLTRPGGFLTAVAATSRTNAWAVGDYQNSDGSESKTLIEHWNGKAWKVQPSPNPSRHYSYLAGVAATSSTNAWAVGNTNQPVRSCGCNEDRSLIEHWNGKAWKVVPSPNIERFTDLNAVTATSSANAWAVGSPLVGGRALIVHWNGKAWKVVPSPSPPRCNLQTLNGVAATSSTNAWAVGACDHYSVAEQSDDVRTLVEHWNGRAWKVVPGPSPVCTVPVPSSGLNGVAATSSTNAWAVGLCDNWAGAYVTSQTVIEHWNGKAWKIQQSPSSVVAAGGELDGVAAVSSRHAWAVGQLSAGTNLPLILRWNGNG